MKRSREDKRQRIKEMVRRAKRKTENVRGCKRQKEKSVSE
jgi:hypothetical protein